MGSKDKGGRHFLFDWSLSGYHSMISQCTLAETTSSFIPGSFQTTF